MRRQMVRSNFLTVVIAATLVFANVVCACATAEAAATTSDGHAHHHAEMQATSDHPPCHHQECEGCADLLDNCQTPEYSLATLERDNRPGPAAKVDPDDPDPGILLIDTGPPLPALALATGAAPPARSVLWPAVTPVQLKDQLIE